MNWAVASSRHLADTTQAVCENVGHNTLSLVRILYLQETQEWLRGLETVNRGE